MPFRFNPSRKNIFRTPHLRVGFSWGGPLDRAIPENYFQTHPISTPLPPIPYSDEFWMLEALRESMTSIGITNPNPAVGCVLVDSTGRVELARGATQKYGDLHAEALALKRFSEKGLAKSRLKNSTLYVTLEPCSHHGKQPPCIESLLTSPIRRIVIARQDPHPSVNGRGIQKLREAGKIVDLGILSHEATTWNAPFFLSTRKKAPKRPMIALKWAQTLDGQLADDHDTSQWITGPIARSYTHWLRQRYDGVLIGAGTLLKDHPSLDARDCQLPHQNDPLPIILDPKGRSLDLDIQLRRTLLKKTFHPGRQVVLLTSSKAWKNNPTSWIRKCKNVVVQTFSGDLIDGIPRLLPRLLEAPSFGEQLQRPLQSIMVEGGAETLGFFLKAQCVDLLHVFVAPLLTGGHENRIQLLHSLPKAQSFDLIAQNHLGADTLLEMTPKEITRELFHKFQAH